jgi:glutamyl-tRNA synthetase
VREYRQKGYLPEAMLNFFALMAWHPEGEREVYSIGELIEGFRLNEVGRASPTFDLEKLTWLNGVYMRRLLDLDLERVADLCAGILQREGLLPPDLTPPQRAYLKRVVAVVAERLRTGQDIIAYGDYFFRDAVYDSEAAAQHLTPAAAPLLAAYAEALAAVDPFEHGAIEAALRGVCARAGVEARALVHPARVALTGKTFGPGLFELTEVLGRDRSVERLRRAADHAGRSGA